MSTKSKTAAQKASETGVNDTPQTTTAAQNKAAKKKPAKKADNAGTGRSTEKAGVGTQSQPETKRVPEGVLLKRNLHKEMGMKISETGPEVIGDKTLMILDSRNGSPVHVSLIEGIGLTKDTDGRLIFIETNVIHDLMTLEIAKRHFAVKKDGTVIYGQQGFDDAANAEFDMLDIVALIEHNNGIKKAKEKTPDAE